MHRFCQTLQKKRFQLLSTCNSQNTLLKMHETKKSLKYLPKAYFDMLKLQK